MGAAKVRAVPVARARISRAHSSAARRAATDGTSSRTTGATSAGRRWCRTRRLTRSPRASGRS
eukprot:2170051-Pyramimonas_sp.AAC.1